MIYNKALAIISNRYKKHNQSVSAFTLKKLLPVAKRSKKYHWLKHYDSIAMQQEVINLGKSFKGFFSNQVKYPCFKKRLKKLSGWYASSKTCNIRKSLIDKLTLDIRKWHFISRNTKHGRDINASINIKLEVLKLLIMDGIAVTAI